ncbi:MAG TPA: glycosyltransferase family 4 protein [Solirubrobacteraceae bacterium]
MRVLVFHGYLLRGTGSNVYNASLCAALARSGHSVDLLSQERRPHELDFVDAVGTWEAGRARVEVLREPVRVTAWRPDIGGLLPVYVLDRYEGMQARTFLECSDDEIEAYVAANVAAIRDVSARAAPDVVLANHLVMGPAIVSRALGGEVPYAVKVHGSALEYVVKRDPERFLPWAREGLAGANAVLVGSRHTGESLWAAMDDPRLPERTRLGPPGVDVDEFRPYADVAGDVRALARRLAASGDERGESAFSRDGGAAARALEGLDFTRDRHACFIGKLIVSKGVDLMLAAWPLVHDARLVVVGFGAFREGFEQLLNALAAGDRDAVRAIAQAGRELEGGPRAPLRHLMAFLDGADDAYWAAARELPQRVVLTGRLEHDELAPLLAGCEALIFPSTFPEAFGMVAAEAAACGVLPISAGHSGAAEVSAMLAKDVPAAARGWLSFPIDDDAVRAIAERVNAWLAAPEDVRERTRAGLVATARERYSWEGVASGVLAAAQGDLRALPPVA